MTSSQVEQLLAAMGDSFRPIAAVCAYSGLRISEALARSWADLDLKAKTIEVSKQLDGDGTVRHTTKTAASSGEAPVLPALERQLRDHRSRQAGIDLRLVKKDALVFTTAQGKPQGRRNALRAVQRAAVAAGLTVEGQQPLGFA